MALMVTISNYVVEKQENICGLSNKMSGNDFIYVNDWNLLQNNLSGRGNGEGHG